MTTAPTMQERRDARLAAAREARSTWTRPVVDPDAPTCTVTGCKRPLHRSGRCASHWSPLRSLVAGMAGAEGSTVSRRTFSEAMATTTMRIPEWEALQDADAAEVEAILDRATDALYAAGWLVAQGPRGGQYLRRRAQA